MAGMPFSGRSLPSTGPLLHETVELFARGCDHAAVAEVFVIVPQTARTLSTTVVPTSEAGRLEVTAMLSVHGLLDRPQQKGACIGSWGRLTAYPKRTAAPSEVDRNSGSTTSGPERT